MAVMVTPSRPWSMRFWPVSRRLGMGVRGDSMVSRGWRLSLRRPKAVPRGVKV